MADFKEHLRAEKSLADLTVRNYLTDLQPLYEYMQFKKVSELRSLDRYALRGYLAWLTEIGYVRPSVARKLSTLRTFLRWLVRHGIIEGDPMPRRGPLKTEKRLPRFLSREQAERLLEAPDTSEPLGIRDRALLELTYAGGLRVSEVSGPDAVSARCKARSVQREQRRDAVSEPVRRKTQPAQHSAQGQAVQRQGGPVCRRTPAHVASLLRDTHAGRRGRPQDRSGAPRALKPGYDADLHARHGLAGAEGVPRGPSKGDKGRP